MLRGAARQRAPAAADVEQPLAGFQPQLAADHLQLVLLHLVDVVVPVGAVAAGVDHLAVEPERVERIGDVVVVGDILFILILFRAPVAGPVIRDAFERPWPAPRGRARISLASRSPTTYRGCCEIRVCAPWGGSLRYRRWCRCEC